MILLQKSTLALTVTGCLAVMLLTKCGSSASDGGKEAQGQGDVVLAKQDWIQAQRDSVAGYQNFKVESTARVIKNGQIIANFKVKIMTGEKAMKARYQKRLFELERKNKDLGKQLDQYSEAGSGKWEIFKSKWEHDMGNLVKSLQEMTKNNKQ